MILRRSIAPALSRLLLGFALAGAAPLVGPGQEPGDQEKEKKAAQAEERDKTPPPDIDDPENPGPAAFALSTDGAIRLFEGRVRANPRDYSSLTLLGEWLARKAREAPDLDQFARAEDALRKALALAPKNVRTRTALAAVLADRHKFAEAADLAVALLRESPTNQIARATLGDAYLELGRYEEAEAAFRALTPPGKEPDAPVLARLARMAELRGKTDEAVALLSRAVDREKKSSGGGDDPSWYRVRLGDLLFDAGRLDDAEAQYRAVLKESPDHHDATANMGKVLAAKGRTAEAIALYEKAVGIAAEPPMLSALGDLYEKAGRADKARETFDRLEAIARRHPEYRRELAMFYAESGRNRPEAIALALEDLDARPDLFGHDTLAWALYRGGDAAEAAKQIDAATKLGTRDARILFHAAMIHRKLGDRARARDELARALAINPHFSIRHAEEARRALEELRAP